MNITLSPISSANGFFVASLVCQSNEVQIMKVPYSSVVGENEVFNIKARLDSNLIGNLNGDCLVKASHGDDKGNSLSFKISSDVDTFLDIEGNIFEPLDVIKFSGTATLKNGKDINGTAKVYVNSKNISSTVPIINGKFSGELTLLENIASGVYKVTLQASQNDSNGDTLNSGGESVEFRVKQIVRAIEIALANTEVGPGENLSYQIVLYDQTLGKAVNDVSVSMISPSGRTLSEQSVRSGVKHYFVTNNTYTPGEWTLQARVNNVEATSNFEIKSVNKLGFSISNNTILIYNDGNVPYSGSVEIGIGNNVEVVAINLGVGQEKLYGLYAPDGNYDIIVKYSNQNISFGNAWLTGRAVKVSDLELNNGSSTKTIIWAVVVLVLGSLAYIAYREFSKNRSYSSPISVPKVKETKKLSDLTSKSTISSSYGNKEEVTSVVLKVKNYNELEKYKGSEPAMKALVEIAGLAKRAKAQVSREGNFTIMNFSKSATGNENPHLLAVRVGKEIESTLKSHNRKYARKVSFGLGAVTGEMIVEKKNGNLMHTALGTLVLSGKKIANHANEELLLGDTTRNKLRGLIKVDKGIGGMYWNIQSFVNHDNHNEFIQKFMERRADESKSF